MKTAHEYLEKHNVIVKGSTSIIRFEARLEDVVAAMEEYKQDAVKLWLKEKIQEQNQEYEKLKETHGAFFETHQQVVGAILNNLLAQAKTQVT